MNEVTDKFLFTRDEFMPETHLKQSHSHLVQVDYLQKTKN